MGWLFKSGYNKSDLIKHLIKPEENEQRRIETLRHCVRGNVLWSVVEITEKQENRRWRVIACHLLAAHSDGFGWGYKDMQESCHPLYYSCPLKYLELVPEVANESWREGVRSYHQRHRKIAVGERVALINSEIPWVDVVSSRPLVGVYGGVRYRVPRSFVGAALSSTTASTQ